MSSIYYNSLSQEEDFWKDVAEAPKRIMRKKNKPDLHFNVHNLTRLRKFEQFIQNQTKETINRTHEGISPQKKIIKKIDRMILLAKRNDENRRRIYEQHIKEKESIEVSKCTFHPNIHPIRNQMKNSSVASRVTSSFKMSNKGYYEKSLLWSRNLKGKKAKMRQRMHLESKEYSFTPQINQRSLDFNKVQSDFLLPQNPNFLRTQANNKKKRSCSSQITLNQSGEKRIKTSCTSRSMSFLCSIEVLKNELRNSCADLKEDNDLNQE